MSDVRRGCVISFIQLHHNFTMNAPEDDDEILMQEILEKVTAGVAIRTLAKEYDKSE